MKTLRLLLSTLVLSAFVASSSFVASSFAADVTITAANVIPSTSAEIDSGTAGTAITGGQLVFRRASDNKLYLADANVTTNGEYKVVGMAAHGASSGQRLHYIIEDPSLTIGGTVAAGTIYILSATPGAIAPSSDAATGHYVSFVALATSAVTVKFQILRSDVVKP